MPGQHGETGGHTETGRHGQTGGHTETGRHTQERLAHQTSQDIGTPPRDSARARPPS